MSNPQCLSTALHTENVGKSTVYCIKNLLRSSVDFADSRNKFAMAQKEISQIAILTLDSKQVVDKMCSRN
jgi:hypothetical protein